MTAPHASHTPHASPTTVNPLATTVDPLADAVVAELDLLGEPALRALDTGLRHGPAALHEPPPAAVVALLRQLESGPSGVDPLMLHRGDVVSLSVPPLWFGLCSLTGALAHAYASPAVAARLARVGSPAAMAPRRLAGTGVWARQTMRPGGLLRGAPGYLATVRLRLLHARTRLTALERDREATGGDASGRVPLAGRGPSSPLSLPHDDERARMWLGLTLVSFRALAAVGIEIGPEEEHYLYRYWSYVAHLLGLDESFYGNVRDHADAERLRALLDTATDAPDENSRALTTAMVDAQARAMAGAPGAVLSEEQLSYLIHSVLRQAFGDGTADRLGVPVPTATDLMPLIGKLNRQSRYWQTFSPASAGEARRRALRGPGPELIATVLPTGGATDRRNGGGEGEGEGGTDGRSRATGLRGGDADGRGGDTGRRGGNAGRQSREADQRSRAADQRSRKGERQKRGGDRLGPGAEPQIGEVDLRVRDAERRGNTGINRQGWESGRRSREADRPGIPAA
ncbi:DUF2236 domain-containing protein [Streptomyces phaeolivaceus]|uniref:DUF2236 domain-containing protein n=1 Tax=Streptomyces phaeolivaceus TaxID=2653200 RepID=A0A5P8KD05_9ACTN|nr:oxygenase MpaB family protein [Streptomyces phaeolivaceus]QFR01146.1 DUF2236 domain-containing protein [Streptomyces phaeolivaceus]